MDRRWRHWQRLGGAALVALVVAAALELLPWKLLERLEWQVYDQRVRLDQIGTQDPALKIIDIDERSLQALGQWPWPRTLLAELIETLFEEHDAALLGVDVVFAEPETALWQRHWEQLREQYPVLEEASLPDDGDQRLAEVLAGYPVVLGYYFQSDTSAQALSSSGALPEPLDLAEAPPLPLPEPGRFTGNLEVLQQAAMGGGFFDNPRVDADGVYRRMPMLQRWQDEVYPALPLAMLLTLLGQPQVSLVVAEGAGQPQLEALDVGGFEIPVDGRGAALVPWYGPRGHFDYVSAVDVLEGEMAPGELAGTTLILGASAPGLMDLRATPVGAVFPGPEIHLNLLAGMLHQSFMADPPWVAGAELVALVGLGALMVVLYPLLGAPWLMALSVVLVALSLGGNWWAWQQGLVLPLAGLLVLLVVQLLWHLSANLLRSHWQKQWVAARFGQYVPPALVEDMVDSDEDFGLAGEERELTVLFSDIRDFTAFAESLTPRELTEVMNRLLTPLTAAIHLHGGTIDKYMGDAVMAFWGAPLRDPDHAEHALHGAWAMREALEAVNRELHAEGKPPLSMGLGLNSGEMSVGNMGSRFRMAYTVMGDNVNLGSRLEALTKTYGVAVIVSESVVARAPAWIFRRLDRVRVKGRKAPLWIYEPLGLAAVVSGPRQQWVGAYEAAVECYQQGDFSDAEAAFRALPDDDPVTQLYLARLAELRRQPPSEWDGVWRHLDK
ncbi:adenylate/guanylate cyclase domain-containing protein [Halomonas sp. MCCC 1A11036]|uniref:Adenylate/guanylate cyclase domain-containing protein n=2 Tax=Billgrantia zhangzhouensis TaxID=2733481 RepID=A0ABS9AL10_9GAMM|nr:adenylate/guanylate cyclase domain-containing protein [Halomonas zhangzhouensis]